MFGCIICVGYLYIIFIRIIIIIWVTISKNALQNQNQKSLKSNQRNLWKRFIKFYILLIRNESKNSDLWCLYPCLIFALIATFYRPYFFIFCIIVFIIYSNSLMAIISVFWGPKYLILWTIFLTMSIIYIYSVISLTMFRNDYSQNISNSCESVFDCYVTIVDQWYKNNGLGGYLSTNVPAISLNNKFNINWGRFIFDITFFFVVPMMLINFMPGIIVDYFSERRARYEKMRENQLSKCFVCGKFHNEIEDFSQHIKYLHNCWDYVYYIGYLKSTAYEDLVDYADIYVKRMIESNKVQWFPCYFRENNEDFSITSSIQGISSRLEMLEKSNIDIMNNNKEMENKIDTNHTNISNRLNNIEVMLYQFLKKQKE